MYIYIYIYIYIYGTQYLYNNMCTIRDLLFNLPRMHSKDNFILLITDALRSTSLVMSEDFIREV